MYSDNNKYLQLKIKIMAKFITKTGKFIKGWYTYEHNLTETGAYRFGYTKKQVNDNPKLVNNSSIIWEYFEELPLNSYLQKETE